MDDLDDYYKDEEEVEVEKEQRKRFEEHADVSIDPPKQNSTFLLNYDFILPEFFNTREKVSNSEITLLLQNHACWNQETADIFIHQTKDNSFFSLFIALVHRNFKFMSFEEREYYLDADCLQNIIFSICKDQYLYWQWLKMFLDILIIHLLNPHAFSFGKAFLGKLIDCFHFTNGYLLIGIIFSDKDYELEKFIDIVS